MKVEVASYTIQSTKCDTPFDLKVLKLPSIVDYEYLPNPSKAAIVGATDLASIAASRPSFYGVDRAIFDAGGSQLMKDRRRLLQDDPKLVFHRTGSAVITGPDTYGSLRVPYVIYAFGPNYHTRESDEGDELLHSAYTSCLMCAKSANLEAVAFSLISAGADRGNRDLKDILRIGINAIQKFEGYDELKEVAVIAYSGLGNKMTPGDADVLIEVCREMGLKKKKKGLISKIKTPFTSPKYTPYEQEKGKSRPRITQSTKEEVKHRPRITQSTEEEVKQLLGNAQHNMSSSNDLNQAKQRISKAEPIPDIFSVSKPIPPSRDADQSLSRREDDDIRLHETNYDDSASSAAQLLSCPSNYDPDVFYSLPLDMQLEVIGEHNEIEEGGDESHYVGEDENDEEDHDDKTDDYEDAPGDMTYEPFTTQQMKNMGTSNDLSTSSEMITKEKSNKSSLNPNNLLRLSSELVTVDESLCLLGRLVANAAARRDLPFIPSSDPILNQDLHLQNPLVDPSGITLDTYFRRDGVYRQDKRDDAYPAVASEREENQSISNVGNFDTIRWRLNAAIDCLDAPLELPSLYVNEIKTETMLGEGFYGDVRLGIDIVIGKKFAIKMIKPIVFEQALASRLETIQKSFQNEIKVLSKLRHPNIAALYGYCLGETNLQNSCLVYELAGNGSLDKFWIRGNDENRLQRERLSEARSRARIALEIATVLRYMHEGLNGGAKCFHRDIKSANICLMADFSVRIVDCGLAKYVTEEPGEATVSVGRTGTPGYTCPQYLQWQISFQSACDVFSLGVVICELVTGVLSRIETQHQMTYIVNGRNLEEDADICVDWDDGCLQKMSSLALKCMAYSASSRPLIGDIVKELQDIVNGSCDVQSDEQLERSLDSSSSPATQCNFCGEVSDRSVTCRGSTSQHTHCHNCLQSALLRNINGFRYGGVTCLKDGCDSERFKDDELARTIMSDTLDAYYNQRSSALIQMMGSVIMNRVEEKFQQTQELLLQLTAGNGMPCPSLFILVEAGTTGKRLHPKEWAKNAASVKLYLYFVCSHSLRPVSDKCRIKLRYRREWMRAIAPALNLSLDLLQLAMTVFVGNELHVDFAKLKEMDEWAKELLDPAERDAIEEVSRCGGSKNDMSPNLQHLVGHSLSCVAEKAAAQNIRWQSELVPVYDYEKKEPTFVLKEYANNERYRRETNTWP